MSERLPVRRRIATAVSAVALAGLLSVGVAQPAMAADYPSWSDVQTARSSEARTEALISRIKTQIAQLASAAASAAAEAAQRGTELEEADTDFQNAAYRTSELETQAAAAEEAAADARRSAGRVVSQMSRGTGGDLTATLIGESVDDTDGFLKSMSYASKVNDVLQTSYGRAVYEQRNAESLADQAVEARAVREQLRIVAEEALQAAQEASVAADAAVAEQENARTLMEAQLVVLTERRAATEADFAAGEAARIKAEAAAKAERDRLAAAKAERDRKAAEAAAAAGGGGGGGGGGSTPAPPPVTSGWAKPTTGYISSSFGYRMHPVYGTWRLHGGTDIAGGCGTPIYAAASGRVIYSGWYGTYGNWILIQHPDGTQTGYAHIVDGGRLVGYGQQVGAGQLIARQGTTGASTGCHLHFEVRVNGAQINAVPFMRARGISL